MGRPKGSKNKVKAAKPKKLTARDIETNCAECPKPVKREPTFTRTEVVSMWVIFALFYCWIVSDWLASL